MEVPQGKAVVTKNEQHIERLARELERAQGDGDPGLQPSAPWYEHPLYLAYERALDDAVLAEDLPLVPLIEAWREDDETDKQFIYQVRQYRQGYGNLRRLADTGGRSMRTALILSKSLARRMPLGEDVELDVAVPPARRRRKRSAVTDGYVKTRRTVLVDGVRVPVVEKSK